MTYKKIFALLFMTSVLWSCSSDDDSSGTTVAANSVRFTSTEAMEVSESSSTYVSIPVVLSDFTSTDVTVNYTITGDAGTYELGPDTSQPLVIKAGSRQGFIQIQPVDNAEYNNPLNSIVITLTDVSGDDAVLVENTEYAERMIVFTDDDCPLILEGSYMAVTSSGSGAGIAYPVTITKMADISPFSAKYQVSDITFGLYVQGYGSADNPGVFTQSNCDIVINESESPDVVYGGDSFFGSGSYDGTSIKISWSNHYGDNGVTTLTPQ